MYYPTIFEWAHSKKYIDCGQCHLFGDQGDNNLFLRLLNKDGDTYEVEAIIGSTSTCLIKTRIISKFNKGDVPPNLFLLPDLLVQTKNKEVP